MFVLPDEAPRGPYSGRTVLHLEKQILLQTPRAAPPPEQRPRPTGKKGDTNPDVTFLLQLGIET